MYDLICIGGGIANLSLAYTYLKKSHKVLIIEAGPSILNRICPKTKLGYCINCKPCHITSGFGGAGCFSDCKLTYSTQVGGNLINYVGFETFKSLQDKAKDFFDGLGADGEYVHDEVFFKAFKDECAHNDLELVQSEVNHLGTERSYELMVELYNRLIALDCDILCNTFVEDIDFESKTVCCYGHIYNYKKLSIAVGRAGSNWLNKICDKNNILIISNSVDIGVRLETDSKITDFVTDNLYEMKIVYKPNNHMSVRTFCVNPHGYVVQENYENVTCVNGHSFADAKSNNTNFALLCNCTFTTPFNNPNEYGESVCKLANMLGGGKVLVQRLGDLYDMRRTNDVRLANNKIKPTLKDIVSGDLRYAVPENILSAILETIEKLDKVFPGLANSETLLYAPEVKFYSSKICLNQNLQVKGLDDVFFLGDSSGVTHGIIQACMSGIYVAELLNENR